MAGMVEGLWSNGAVSWFGFLNRLGGIGSGQHVSGCIDRWIRCFGIALDSI